MPLVRRSEGDHEKRRGGMELVATSPGWWDCLAVIGCCAWGRRFREMGERGKPEEGRLKSGKRCVKKGRRDF